MPKKLTPQAKAQRLHDQGFSDAQIAKATGFSKSSVGRIRRGQQSGEGIAAAIGEFFKLGKRAKENVARGEIVLPSAKPAPAPKEKKLPDVELPLHERLLLREEGKLAVYSGGMIVVVQVTMGSTGKSRTLFARSGIEARALRGRLRQAIEEQSDRQGGNKNSESPKEIDWSDVIDISVEEF